MISHSACPQELYRSLLDYLEERGIHQEFVLDLVQFYRVFEHHCYLEHGLKPLKHFLEGN